ncbi:MAG: hypothetical protein J1F67_10340 [Muribaculaceae bacterium]|nr:hypothetical protein [Muribaculaceae bacterium]
MNLYIIVEGDKTELQVYPAWMKYLAPQLNRIEDAWGVSDNTYYIFSGGGIPSIYNHIIHSIQDINTINSKGGAKYDILMVCIDTEEDDRQAIENRISSHIALNNLKFKDFEIVVFEHKVCMETWFLGNQNIFKRNPQDVTYRDYIQFYNVVDCDPELMGTPNDEWTKAQFHYRYLKKMFSERHMKYSKTNTKEIEKHTYLNQLILRYKETNDIGSFGRWYDFIRSLK